MLVMPVVASPVAAFAVGDCCRAGAAASAWLNIASAIALGSSLVLSVPSALVLSVAAGAAASVAAVSVSSLSSDLSPSGDPASNCSRLIPD